MDGLAAENRFRGQPGCIHVFRENRSSRESKHLRVRERSKDVLSHLAKVASMAFVDDEDDLAFVVFDGIAETRILAKIGHLLNGCRDHFGRRIRESVVEAFGILNRNHRAFFKRIEIPNGLPIQVSSIDEEDDFAVFPGIPKTLSEFKGRQSFPRASCMPYESTLLCVEGPVHEAFHRPNLVRTENHEFLLGLI